MGSSSIGKKLGDHDKALAEINGNLQMIRKALSDHGESIKKMAPIISALVKQANVFPSAVQNNVDALWLNQKALEWKTNKILSILVPEEYTDPGPLPDEIRNCVTKEESNEGPQADESEGAQETGASPVPSMQSSVSAPGEGAE